MVTNLREPKRVQEEFSGNFFPGYAEIVARWSCHFVKQSYLNFWNNHMSTDELRLTATLKLKKLLVWKLCNYFKI